MLNDDVRATKERYSKRYKQFGVTPKTLGWDKGKQEVRFDVLTSQYCFEQKSILDIGSGFGDLLITLRKKASLFNYTGIEVVDALADRARELHPGDEFITGDFDEYNFNSQFDYCIASGIFNHKMKQDNYRFIKNSMHKAWEISNDGFAFDFLSDKVEYQLEHTFHSSPSKVLDFAYTLSRNVILRNDYMPFEFSVFVFKDDSFNVEDTLFSKYKRQAGEK